MVFTGKGCLTNVNGVSGLLEQALKQISIFPPLKFFFTLL